MRVVAERIMMTRERNGRMNASSFNLSLQWLGFLGSEYLGAICESLALVLMLRLKVPGSREKEVGG